MTTHTLAAALVGFMLGGLTVSIAAELEDDGASSPHGARAPQVVVTSASGDYGTGSGGREQLR